MDNKSNESGLNKGLCVDLIPALSQQGGLCAIDYAANRLNWMFANDLPAMNPQNDLTCGPSVVSNEKNGGKGGNKRGSASTELIIKKPRTIIAKVRTGVTDACFLEVENEIVPRN